MVAFHFAIDHDLPQFLFANWLISVIPDGIYLLKVNNRNTRSRCETCSKLTIKTPEQRLWHRSYVFIVNFEHILHLGLVFFLLTLNVSLPTGMASSSMNILRDSINSSNPQKIKSAIIISQYKNEFFY